MQRHLLYDNIGCRRFIRCMQMGVLPHVQEAGSVVPPLRTAGLHEALMHL